MSKFRIYSERTDFDRRMRLAILVEELNGITQVAAPLVFQQVSEHEVGAYTMDQAIRTERVMPNGDRHFSVLDARALMQAFLDHAWEIGMRPTGLSDVDTTKQITALTYHLEDMRKLVFAPPLMMERPPTS